MVSVQKNCRVKVYIFSFYDCQKMHQETKHCNYGNLRVRLTLASHLPLNYIIYNYNPNTQQNIKIIKPLKLDFDKRSRYM